MTKVVALKYSPPFCHHTLYSHSVSHCWSNLQRVLPYDPPLILLLSIAVYGGTFAPLLCWLTTAWKCDGNYHKLFAMGVVSGIRIECMYNM